MNCFYYGKKWLSLVDLYYVKRMFVLTITLSNAVWFNLESSGKRKKKKIYGRAMVRTFIALPHHRGSVHAVVSIVSHCIGVLLYCSLQTYVHRLVVFWVFFYLSKINYKKGKASLNQSYLH